MPVSTQQVVLINVHYRLCQLMHHRLCESVHHRSCHTSHTLQVVPSPELPSSKLLEELVDRRVPSEVIQLTGLP